MRLRNKKTGEIEDVSISVYETTGDIAKYKTLAELNEDWEDYTYQEPLIEDENIRKAVRVWAYVNATRKVLYFKTTLGSSCNLQDMEDDGLVIQFIGWIPTLKEGEAYTITELCGEEE